MVANEAIAPTPIYENSAWTYDASRFECPCGFLQNEIETRIVSRLIGNSSRVLDAGTGTGRFAIAASLSGRSVVAVDGSRKMIAVAKRKAAAAGFTDSVSWVQADVRNLPFKPSAFGSVVSIRVLSHYRRVGPTLAEFSRVLKPGGDLIIDASNRFASAYRRLNLGSRRQSAPDFFHPVKDIAREMATHSISLASTERYAIVPFALLHRTLCAAVQWRARAILRATIQTQVGFSAIVRGVKTA